MLQPVISIHQNITIQTKRLLAFSRFLPGFIPNTTSKRTPLYSDVFLSTEYIHQPFKYRFQKYLKIPVSRILPLTSPPKSQKQSYIHIQWLSTHRTEPQHHILHTLYHIYDIANHPPVFKYPLPMQENSPKWHNHITANHKTPSPKIPSLRFRLRFRCPRTCIMQPPLHPPFSSKHPPLHGDSSTRIRLPSQTSDPTRFRSPRIIYLMRSSSLSSKQNGGLPLDPEKLLSPSLSQA